VVLVLVLVLVFADRGHGLGDKCVAVVQTRVDAQGKVEDSVHVRTAHGHAALAAVLFQARERRGG